MIHTRKISGVVYLVPVPAIKTVGIIGSAAAMDYKHNVDSGTIPFLKHKKSKQ